MAFCSSEISLGAEKSSATYLRMNSTAAAVVSSDPLSRLRLDAHERTEPSEPERTQYLASWSGESMLVDGP